jgi:hypothetical protein
MKTIPCFFIPRCKQFFYTAVIIFLSAGATHAQVQWTNAGAATDWYTGSNWTPNTVPVEWLPTNVAQFNNAGTATTTGIDMSQGSLSIAAIQTTSLRTRDIVIGNSSATPGTLTLNGDATNTIIYNGVSGNFSAAKLILQDNETGTGKTMNIVLNNPVDNIINTAANSHTEISCSISGVGKKLTLVGASVEGGELTLSGANTYTGLTSILTKNAHLYLSHPGGGTLPATNDIYMTEGTLFVRTDQTLRNIDVLGLAVLQVENGATLTITGKLRTVPRISLLGGAKIVYAPGATLEYLSTGLSAVTSTTEFPLVNGPTNVITNLLLVLNAPRTISGTLTVNGSSVRLGNNDFTVGAVNLTGGGQIVTNGTGRLIIANIGVAPVLFPVTTGTGKYNPVTISNGQGLSYAIRVEDGITPALSSSNTAVNRTWYIQPSALTVTPVNAAFGYANTDGNAGFSYSAPVELLQYNGAWSQVQTNIMQTQPLPTTIPVLTASSSTPFVIQNISGPLAIEPIEISAVKQNNNAEIRWAIHIATAIQQTELERSADGSAFTALTIAGNNVNSYTDDKLLNGTNYYRIKVTDINGRINYNKIIAVINKASGFDIVNLLPNIVTDAAVLNVTSAQQTKMNVVITDMMGHKIQESAYALVAGSNQFSLNLAHLAAGTYQISGYTADGFKKTIRFVKQ